MPAATLKIVQGMGLSLQMQGLSASRLYVRRAPSGVYGLGSCLKRRDENTVPSFPLISMNARVPLPVVLLPSALAPLAVFESPSVLLKSACVI